MDSTRHRLAGEVATFAVIGVVSTLVYAILYIVLRRVVGPATANGVSLIVTAIGNTAANRRLTFGVSGRASMVRDQAVGLLAFLIGLAITTSAALGLSQAAPTAGRFAELAVLIAANGLATVVRFLVLRGWLRSGARSTPTIHAPEPSGSRS